MNKINKHNYEAYLLDYSEGVLPAEEVAELLLFIETNPALKIDLTEFDLIYLESPSETYEAKDNLKSIPRIEELVIGYTESVLNEDEKAELKALESVNPSIVALKSAYKEAILPLEQVSFPNRKALKRTRVVPIYWVGALAAAVFVGLIIMLDFGEDVNRVYTSGNSVEKINKVEFTALPILDEIANSNIDSLPEEKEIANPISFINDNALATNTEPKDVNKQDSAKNELPDKILPEPFVVLPNDIVEVKNDSIFPVVNDDVMVPQEEIAMVNPLPTESLTIIEFIKVKTKEIVQKDKGPSDEVITGNELIASLAEGINAKTKMDVAYQNEESDNKRITKFKLGKVEFYKSSSK
jgi:hypothetical protein